MNRWQSLVALVVVFIALIAIFILQNNNEPSSPLENSPDVTTSAINNLDNGANPITADLSRIFETVSESRIQAIRFEDPFNEDVITMQRNVEGQWQAIEFTSLINQDIATALAQTIAILPYSTTLEDVDETTYSQFGLTLESVLMLASVVMDSGDEHVVAIGILTPDNQSHYVLIDERPEIYIVPRQPVSFLLTYPSQMAN